MTEDLFWITPEEHEGIECKYPKQCVHIVSGGCSQGGDKFAEIIAEKWKIPITIHRPDYEADGKSATFVRNKRVAEDSDMIIACVSLDRTGGTEHTIKKFKSCHPQGEVTLV